MGDLAPRDVVAAAIDARLRDTGDPCVYLDARGIADFERRFPTVTAACRAAGIDPTRQPIPVVPGAHYSCGGVVTDVHGRTDLPGLFAAGEVARTGMHGANRLASNSLLEGLVVGGRAGKAAAQHAVDAGPAQAELGEVETRVALPRKVLQRAMSHHASVVRDGDGLQRLTQELDAAVPRDIDCRADFEDVALTVTARTVAAAALARTESRGCHHRSDFPDTDPALAHSLVLAAAAADGAQRRRADRSSQGDRARSGRRPALRPRRDHAGDGVPPMRRTTASMVTREPGVIAGVDVALLVLDEVLGQDGYRVKHRVDDGARLESGAVVLIVEAPTQGLLTAERTMLNLVCHLSGIATTTAAWVEAVRAPTRRSATPARRCRACGRCRSTRCGSAAASTTGWGSAMQR